MIIRFSVDHDCLQNCLSLFLSLSTTKIVKNIHILTWIYFIFLKKIIVEQIWKSFTTKVGPKSNDRKGSHQVRQFLVLFLNLFAVILG